MLTSAVALEGRFQRLAEAAGSVGAEDPPPLTVESVPESPV
ncbi:hypothetical protein [Chlamydia caviae]